MTKSTAISLAVLAVILAFGGGIALGDYVAKQRVKNQVSNEEIATSIQAATSDIPVSYEVPTDWKTYTNTKFGYSVKFPPEYIVVEPSADEGKVTPKNDYIMISATNSEGSYATLYFTQDNEEGKIEGVTVSRTFKKQSQNSENNVKEKSPKDKFAYLKKNYSFATMAGTAHELDNDQNGKEIYYSLQTKFKNNWFFELGIDYHDTKNLEDIAKINQILSTIKFS